MLRWALVDGVETAIADLAAQSPEVAEASFMFGYVSVDGVMVLRDPDDVMMTVPAGLGMTLSEPVLAIPQGQSFAVPVGLEQLDALDADVLAVYDGGDREARSTVEASPLWPTLSAVQRDAVVELDDDQFFALRQPTALSIPWVLSNVAPALVAAVQQP